MTAGLPVDFELDLGEGKYLEWILDPDDTTKKVGGVIHEKTHETPTAYSHTVVVWTKGPDQDPAIAVVTLEGEPDENLTIKEEIPIVEARGFITKGKWNDATVAQVTPPQEEPVPPVEETPVETVPETPVEDPMNPTPEPVA